MIFGINKKKYNDRYNVLLAIATNIPVRLMTGFVIHILLFSNVISKYFISHIYHVYINTFYKWYIYNNWLQAGSYLRWSGFECSLFSCSSEVVADGCTGSSWSHNNRRTYSASAKQAENVSTTTKRRLHAFTGYWWLPIRNHTHLWGSFNTLELRTHTFISPSLPKVVQTLL